jgi:uncharacterized membrane protein YtjA (UPF0391 family)
MRRSADWQSAVSRIGNPRPFKIASASQAPHDHSPLRRAGISRKDESVRRLPTGDTADNQSALRNQWQFARSGPSRVALHPVEVRACIIFPHKLATPASGTWAASWMLKGKQQTTEISMLSWSIIFLIVALIAAFLGFAGIAGTAAWIAKILFVVFLVLFLVSLIFGRRVR